MVKEEESDQLNLGLTCNMFYIVILDINKKIYNKWLIYVPTFYFMSAYIPIKKCAFFLSL